MSRVVDLLLRLGLAAIMIYAGAIKLGDTAAFAEEITNYRLLPSLAPLLAVTLPTVEITAGLALLVPPRAWRQGAALLLIALLSTFTVAVSLAKLRGIDIRCGCFGTSDGPIDAWTILRDLVLVAWAVAVLRFSRP